MNSSNRTIINAIAIVSIVILGIIATAFLIGPSELKRMRNQITNASDETVLTKSNGKEHVDIPPEDFPSNTGSKEHSMIGNSNSNKIGLVDQSYAADDNPDEALQMAGGVCDTLQPGENNKHEMNITSAKRVSFICFCNGYVRLAAIDPHGVKIDSASIGKDKRIAYENTEMEEGQNIIAISFANNPPGGKWVIEVSNPAKFGKPVSYALTASYEEPSMKLKVTTDKEQYQKGEPIIITAVIIDGATPVMDANVNAYVWDTAAGEYAHVKIDTLRLFDDGSHGDPTARDGRYTNKFTNTSGGGEFSISVQAEKGGAEPFALSSYELAIVSTHRAMFNRKFADFTQDTNKDGLIDNLIITVGVSVTDPAQYLIGARLGDKNGEGIDDITVDTLLTAGEHNIQLVFNGNRIYERHAEGPFQLSSLSLEVSGSSLSGFIERLDNAYTTKKFDTWDFQGPGVFVGENYEEKVIDIDGDGLYDSLLFTVEVELRESDFYHWQADIFCKGATQALSYVYGKGHLDAGKQNITTVFSGRKIGRNGVDGPYRIGAGVIYGTKRNSSLGREYRTKPYRADQFEK
jgi:hypothetical protein